LDELDAVEVVIIVVKVEFLASTGPLEEAFAAAVIS